MFTGDEKYGKIFRSPLRHRFPPGLCIVTQAVCVIIRKNVPGSLSHRLPINVELTAAVQLVTIVPRAKRQSTYVLRGPLVMVEPPDLDHLVQKLKMIVISVPKDSTVSQVKKGGHAL